MIAKPVPSNGYQAFQVSGTRYKAADRYRYRPDQVSWLLLQQKLVVDNNFLRLLL